MRTTLTLDDDVAAMIERIRRARGTSLKDIVNEALRRGLSDLATAPKCHEAFKSNNVALGRLRLASIENISESLAIAEGQVFR